jgi:hypothetical protein
LKPSGRRCSREPGENDPARSMSYGTGDAAKRIVDALEEFLEK